MNNDVPVPMISAPGRGQKFKVVWYMFCPFAFKLLPETWLRFLLLIERAQKKPEQYLPDRLTGESGKYWRVL